MVTQHSQPSISGFRCDTSGHSLAFYPILRSPAVSETEIRQLIDYTMQAKRSSRICLHESPDDALQFMIIAQYKGFDPGQPLMRVHRMKEKVFQPIFGRLLMICASPFGQIENEKILDPEKGGVQLVSRGQFYNDLPLDEVTVHSEFVLGPFNSNLDREFPIMPWDTSISEKKNFYDSCIKRAEGM